MKHALKEWAVICKELAEGKQALLIRKGGIGEPEAEFRLEHTRFWLFPTYGRQEDDEIRDEAVSLLRQVEAEQPPSGTVRISHFAEVIGVYHVRDLTFALILAHLHYWSDETVENWFGRRAPGLYVMPVRVYKARETFNLPDAYEGRQTWVELERDLSTDDARPVLSDKEMDDVHRSLDLLLSPRAIV